MKLNSTIIGNWLAILLIFLVNLPLIWPLFQSGFFRSDDGDWMVIRLASFVQTLKTGQFPVRFLYSLNHGYGYPVTNFNYPLPFYLGGIIHFLGLGFIDSVKLLFASSFLLGSLFMFKWISAKWGWLSGLAAGLFYAYFPYHIYDTYTRGSLGETTAFIFLPLVFLLLDKYISNNSGKFLVLSALSITALITSHNIIAFILLPIVVFYYFWQSKRTVESSVGGFLIFLLSLGLSAFFWLPALFDIQFIRDSIQVSDYSVYFLTWNSFWNLVGPVSLFVFVMDLIFYIKLKNPTILFFLLLSLSSVFIATSLSNVVWQALPLPKLVQFPWRFLSLTMLSGSVLVGYFVYVVKNKPIVWFLLMTMIVSGLLGMHVKTIARDDGYYESNDDTTTIKNEYMPRWVTRDPTNAPAKHLEIVAGSGEIVGTNQVEAEESVVVQINTVYFPGWKILVDGNEAVIDYSNNGIMRVSVGPDRHIITSKFTETPWRLFANLLSLLSLAIGVWLAKRG